LKANQKKPLKVEDVKLLSDYLKTLALTKKEVSNLLNSSEVEFQAGWNDDADTS
jgi:hypothetical protein